MPSGRVRRPTMRRRASEPRPIRAPRIISVRLAGVGPAIPRPVTGRVARGPEDAAGDDRGHVLTPEVMFSNAAGSRAADRVGPIAYAFLRSLALEGVTLLASVIEGFDTSLRALSTLPRAEQGEDHGLRVYQAAIGAQWQTMAHFCVAAERLVSIVGALERYRAGTLHDADRAVLEPKLDLFAVIDRKEVRRPRFWRSLGGLPDAEGLSKAGLNPSEASALAAAADRWAERMAARWSALRTFYTRDLHRVFLAYKHGFSFVSPRSSRLELRGLDDEETRQVEAMLARGFAVALARRDGTRWLLVIDATPEELLNAYKACAVVLASLRSLALSWVMELEHELSRSAAIDVDIDAAGALPGALDHWFGAALDPVYRGVFADALDVVRRRAATD